MDAVKFLQEWNRMCKILHCHDCLFFDTSRGCEQFSIEHPVEAVAFVEKWSAEHPAKTNRDKFFEVFGIDPRPAGYVTNHNRAEGLATEWWDRPYEEPKEEE